MMDDDDSYLTLDNGQGGPSHTFDLLDLIIPVVFEMLHQFGTDNPCIHKGRYWIHFCRGRFKTKEADHKGTSLVTCGGKSIINRHNIE